MASGASHITEKRVKFQGYYQLRKPHGFTVVVSKGRTEQPPNLLEKKKKINESNFMSDECRYENINLLSSTFSLLLYLISHKAGSS